MRTRDNASLNLIIGDGMDSSITLTCASLKTSLRAGSSVQETVAMRPMANRIRSMIGTRDVFLRLCAMMVDKTTAILRRICKVETQSKTLRAHGDLNSSKRIYLSD